MKTKKTILIYSQSSLDRDPRVHRQLELLAKEYRIIAFGKKAPAVPVSRFVNLSALIGIPEHKKLSLKFLKDYVHKFGLSAFFITGAVYFMEKLPVFLWFQEFVQSRVLRGRVLRRLESVHCDLILANDITALAVCARAKGNRSLWYDAHEYTPGQLQRNYKNLGKRSYARFLLKKYLPSCDAMSTIGYGIAGLYREHYGASCEVITNAPAYRDLAPVDRCDGKIRLVHQGLAEKRRGLETMIDVMRFLDQRFTLDFFLIAHDSEYYRQLRLYASKDPRIVFNDPVPMQSLPEVLNRYDIGFRFYQPRTINMKHGLPNKFFEFVQARLAVAVGPTPEAVRFIEHYGFGLVSKDFTPASMADILSALTPSLVMEYKERAHRCALELSATPNNEKMAALVRILVGNAEV
jgi:hypothetical protein